MSGFMHMLGKAGMQWSHIHHGRKYCSPRLLLMPIINR